MSDGKHKLGRPHGTGFIEKPVHVGLKMPAELEKKFIDKVTELRAKNIKTNKSDLIRTLAEYWLDDAEDILTEVRKSG